MGFLLRLAHQRATANLSQAIGGHGLTPAAFVTLARLHESGPISQNELGRAVGMAPANIHAIVRRLRAAGLLDAQPSPSDRRALLIDLSDAGRALLEEVLPDADAANRRTLEPLGELEQRTAARASASARGRSHAEVPRCRAVPPARSAVRHLAERLAHAPGAVSWGSARRSPIARRRAGAPPRRMPTSPPAASSHASRDRGSAKQRRLSSPAIDRYAQTFGVGIDGVVCCALHACSIV